MDFSKKYILMCERAKEIQSVRSIGLQNGDFGYSNRINYFEFLQKETVDEDSIILIKCNKDVCESITINYTWWLPRQDQLQEILIKDNSDFDDRYDLFPKKIGIKLSEWVSCWTLSDEYMQQFDSMEQLWLAEIMRSKYNKQWSEEQKDWIKI